LWRSRGLPFEPSYICGGGSLSQPDLGGPALWGMERGCGKPFNKGACGKLMEIVENRTAPIYGGSSNADRQRAVDVGEKGWLLGRSYPQHDLLFHRFHAGFPQPPPSLAPSAAPRSWGFGKASSHIWGMGREFSTDSWKTPGCGFTRLGFRRGPGGGRRGLGGPPRPGIRNPAAPRAGIDRRRPGRSGRGR